MIINVYSIRDLIAEDSGPLFQAKNNAVAVRSFQFSLKDTTTPGDFRLLLIGSFDTETSRLVVLPVAEEVVLTLNDEVIDA